MGWIRTGGWSRLASLQRTARRATPLLGTAVILFFLAALIEGFVSPSALPYAIKAMVGALSGVMLVCYFLILGNLRG
jgi:uncharacterized membrane protein SpoIIM required for sporulation